MNKIYKLKYNLETASLKVVSELATNAVASTNGNAAAKNVAESVTSKFSGLSKLAFAFGVSSLAISTAMATPGNIISTTGNVQVVTNGKLTTITNSPSSIINWDKFNINSDEIVKFVQQNANSAVLNRVLGGSVSQILGQLQSNGKVFIVNPAGVVFGKNSVLDVAGLVVSTLDITDQDFLNGKFVFNQDKDQAIASVLNQGVIKVSEQGTLALVGGNVVNTGTLEAKNGTVYLLSGKSITIQDLDNPTISYKVTAGNKAVNLGEIVSRKAYLLANKVAHGATAANEFADLMSNYASSATTATIDANGEVVLYGAAVADKTLNTAQTDDELRAANISEQGYTVLNGTISANNTLGTGGKVAILGDKVVLENQAQVNVSGIAGGSIHVGGDAYRTGEIKLARDTTVDENAVLNASGTTSSGGCITLWGDQLNFAGTYLATATQGNGGFVETSGKNFTKGQTTINTSSEQGKVGTWLLDPEYVVVYNESNAPTNLTNAIKDSEVAANLATTAVEINATNNITFRAQTNITSQSGNNLSVWTNSTTGSKIEFDNAVVNLSQGNFSLYCGTDSTKNLPADINITNGSIISAQNINVQCSALRVDNSTVNGKLNVLNSALVYFSNQAVSSGEINLNSSNRIVNYTFVDSVLNSSINITDTVVNDIALSANHIVNFTNTTINSNYVVVIENFKNTSSTTDGNKIIFENSTIKNLTSQDNSEKVVNLSLVFDGNPSNGFNGEIRFANSTMNFSGTAKVSVDFKMASLNGGSNVMNVTNSKIYANETTDTSSFIYFGSKASPNVIFSNSTVKLNSGLFGYYQDNYNPHYTGFKINNGSVIEADRISLESSGGALFVNITDSNLTADNGSINIGYGGSFGKADGSFAQTITNPITVNLSNSNFTANKDLYLALTVTSKETANNSHLNATNVTFTTNTGDIRVFTVAARENVFDNVTAKAEKDFEIYSRLNVTLNNSSITAKTGTLTLHEVGIQAASWGYGNGQIIVNNSTLIGEKVQVTEDVGVLVLLNKTTVNANTSFAANSLDASKGDKNNLVIKDSIVTVSNETGVSNNGLFGNLNITNSNVTYAGTVNGSFNRDIIIDNSTVTAGVLDLASLNTSINLVNAAKIVTTSGALSLKAPTLNIAQSTITAQGDANLGNLSTKVLNATFAKVKSETGNVSLTGNDSLIVNSASLNSALDLNLTSANGSIVINPELQLTTNIGRSLNITAANVTIVNMTLEAKNVGAIASKNLKVSNSTVNATDVQGVVTLKGAENATYEKSAVKGYDVVIEGGNITLSDNSSFAATNLTAISTTGDVVLNPNNTISGTNEVKLAVGGNLTVDRTNITSVAGGVNITSQNATINNSNITGLTGVSVNATEVLSLENANVTSENGDATVTGVKSTTLNNSNITSTNGKAKVEGGELTLSNSNISGNSAEVRATENATLTNVKVVAKSGEAAVNVKNNATLTGTNVTATQGTANVTAGNVTLNNANITGQTAIVNATVGDLNATNSNITATGETATLAAAKTLDLNGTNVSAEKSVGMNATDIVANNSNITGAAVTAKAQNEFTVNNTNFSAIETDVTLTAVTNLSLVGSNISAASSSVLEGGNLSLDNVNVSGASITANATTGSVNLTNSTLNATTGDVKVNATENTTLNGVNVEAKNGKVEVEGNNVTSNNSNITGNNNTTLSARNNLDANNTNVVSLNGTALVTAVNNAAITGTNVTANNGAANVIAGNVSLNNANVTGQNTEVNATNGDARIVNSVVNATDGDAKVGA
ncbi:beta strand repeat-containing protein, partial [Psittacicella hinzii]|uniref:beta strand repeat-containing protein n=1 Tax=Psittacicella hinzii TaxID=2028575 RepID=UPI003616208C